jgi:hypothetical protein
VCLAAADNRRTCFCNFIEIMTLERSHIIIRPLQMLKVTTTSQPASFRSVICCFIFQVTWSGTGCITPASMFSVQSHCSRGSRSDSMMFKNTGFCPSSHLNHLHKPDILFYDTNQANRETFRAPIKHVISINSITSAPRFKNTNITRIRTKRASRRKGTAGGQSNERKLRY